MAVGAPLLVIEAGVAEFVAADRAVPAATIAVLLVARLAGRDTLVAEHTFASAAAEIAIAANRGFAFLTRPAIVVAARSAAVRAFGARPVVERHVRAARVVGPQQVGHDHEEIEQPALL